MWTDETDCEITSLISMFLFGLDVVNLLGELNF